MSTRTDQITHQRKLSEQRCSKKPETQLSILGTRKQDDAQWSHSSLPGSKFRATQLAALPFIHD